MNIFNSQSSAEAQEKYEKPFSGHSNVFGKSAASLSGAQIPYFQRRLSRSIYNIRL
jgi:hypothetical protein